MSLININYFIRDIALPIANDNNNYASDITIYEPEILDKLLGYELRALVEANPASPQRIQDLAEGKEYTVEYNGRTHTIKWNGLQNTELISLIAYYIYYWIQRNLAVHSANVGTVKPKQENSFIASPAQKMAGAWHRMRELYGYPGQSIIKPSAYNFLTEHSDDYEEWIFTDIGIVTMFGT